MSFYDPTNSHTNFGQKIFTLRWIATVVELGGFDFTSPFIIDDMIGEGWVPGIIPGEYNWKGMNQDPRDRYNIDVVTY